MKRFVLGVLLIVLIIGYVWFTGPSEWEPDDAFFVKGGDYYISMIGDKDHLGMVIDNEFMAGVKQKAAWYVWGDEKLLVDKSLMIKGIHRESGETIDLAAGEHPLAKTNLYGETASLSADLLFPKSGIWRMDIYIEDDLFGNLVIEVQ